MQDQEENTDRPVEYRPIEGLEGLFRTHWGNMVMVHRHTKKSAKTRDVTLRKQWALNFGYCHACGRAEHQCDFRGLCVHHLIRGSGRSDEEANFLMLCARCHDLAHGHNIRVDGVLFPKITLGHVLTMKRDHDPKNFDPARLEDLYGQRLPDPEPIPQFLVREMAKFRPWHVPFQGGTT